MPVLQDGGRSRMLGPQVTLPARTIVSLVPSLTEAVFLIGAGRGLIGRTDYCIRPAGKVQGIETLRGTKNFSLECVRALRPDVILANKEENERRKILELARLHPVWLTDPQSPRDVPELWRELGRLTGREDDGEVLALRSREALQSARRAVSDQARLSFLYYIWKKPLMAAGHGTYISNLLEAAGFRNALPPDRIRFPRLSAQTIRESAPSVHLFSSEPYPFRLPEDLEESGLPSPFQRRGDFYEAERGVRALLVQAEPLSWYPSLTIEGLQYAAELHRRLTERTVG